MLTEFAAVIGAGPAGLAAASQLELYGISPCVYEPDTPGGLLLNANSVNNYPGVRKGITGRELAAQFPLPGRIVKQKVLKLTTLPSGGYEVLTASESCRYRSVIVASGTKPVRIEIPDFPRENIFSEVKNIPYQLYRSAAVIGGGDAALDYALTLSRTMPVNVYARGDFSGALPDLIRQVESLEKISLFPFTVFPVSHSEDIAVVACGRVPNVAFIQEELVCSPPEDGSFHLCGDCVNNRFRQTAIAVGNGVKAAMTTAEFLK